MLSGELDATLLYLVDPNLVDRSTADLWNHPDIKTLFPDPEAEGIRYYQATGLYPINHGVVIKRSIAEQHPWVVLNLLKAFNQANQITNTQRLDHLEYFVETGLLNSEAYESVGKELLQHGVVANRNTLETVAQYSFEQGLTPKLARLEDIFASATIDQ